MYNEDLHSNVDGFVMEVSSKNGMGSIKVVIIGDDGFYHVYDNLLTVFAVKGMYVKSGQTIGTITDKLHYEVVSKLNTK